MGPGRWSGAWARGLTTCGVAAYLVRVSETNRGGVARICEEKGGILNGVGRCVLLCPECHSAEAFIVKAFSAHINLTLMFGPVKTKLFLRNLGPHIVSESQVLTLKPTKRLVWCSNILEIFHNS